jgi:hypothetical protein
MLVSGYWMKNDIKTLSEPKIDLCTGLKEIWSTHQTEMAFIIKLKTHICVIRTRLSYYSDSR